MNAAGATPESRDTVFGELPKTSKMSSQGLLVTETNPQTDPRWESFVAGHPNASIYHHPLWLEALEREYGQKGVYLNCVDAAGRVLAILPLLYTRGLPFNLGGALAGRRLSSLPRTPIAGPLSIDSRATVAVLQEAVRRVSEIPGARLQIKTEGPELDGLVEGMVCTPWRLTYLLRLPHPSKGPFRIPDGQARAKIKWAVRKASKSGVTVRPAQTEADLRQWYGTYLETMRRNMLPPRPYRFFAALWQTLRPAGMMEVLVAEHGQDAKKKIIAGSVFLMFGRTVSYAFNGMRREYGSLRANDAIQWQAINGACQKGFRLFDFGEVPERHDPLAKFKSKWGAQPTRLYRYVAPAPPAAKNAKVDSPHNMGSILRVIWQYVPLKLTEWAGDQIYRRL